MPRLSKIGAAALAAFGWTGLSSVTVNYLVIAGGGGGGSQHGGGGGAGGLRSTVTNTGGGGSLESALALNPLLSYTVTVGAGGAGSPAGNSGDRPVGASGSNSTFSTITSTGGGGGAPWRASGLLSANSGGSGGGGAASDGSQSLGGAGTANQGFAGGNGRPPSGAQYNAAGGGGAGAVGTTTTNTGNAGNGGVGVAVAISGTSTFYAGGGGGGKPAASGGGTGGNGGGGDGGANVAGTAGTANLGGGGGGGGTQSVDGGNGGSGVVIISYVGAQQFGGGIVTSSGGNTIHTFTTSGTLSPLSSLTASYLIVAGGGGGGGGFTGGGGGGGAGGYRTGSGITIDQNSIYLVTVGSGGSGGSAAGSQGSNSAVFGFTSSGGGFGGYNAAGGTGGSGGGSGNNGAFLNTFAGAAGNTPATSPSQGNNGGANFPTNLGWTGGGGGGADAVGGAGSSGVAGVGGAGSVATAALGSGTYAGGGGGGAWQSGATGGTGGAGGGGNGGKGLGSNGSAATANTGGGGGGGGQDSVGAAGGSGIVIISYSGSVQQMAGGTVTVAGGNVIHTFTSSGFLTPIVLVNNSLRFRASASANLSRTPTTAGAGAGRTWTWSGWIKRGTIGSSDLISLMYGATSAGASDRGGFGFYTYSGGGTGSDSLTLYYGGSFANNLTTAQVFRDPAAWYHVVYAVDTAQATSSNRVKLYVNGSQVTSFSASNYPTLNYQFAIGNNVSQWISSEAGTQRYFDGYMTDINFIDGQALEPTSFGTSNGLGVWQPIRYGGSYGTNGFYLPFTANTESYAGFFGGSGYSIETTATQIIPATGDFTIEAMINFGSLATYPVIACQGTAAVSGRSIFLVNSDGTLNLQNNLTSINSAAGAITTNRWYYVAVTRSGANSVLYINGVQVATNSTTFGTIQNTTFRIGVDFSSDYISSGYVSNVRVSNVVRTISPSTAPTTNFTNDASTVLLTLQGATVVDNSSNAYALTNNGPVTLGKTYPFAYKVFNDQSPQGNNWTPNNISGITGSTLDSMTDVPTLTSATVANYAVMNPLAVGANSSQITFSNGNLTTTWSSAGGYAAAIATIGVSSGKWYWEIVNTSALNSNIGILKDGDSLASYVGQTANGYSWYSSGSKYNNASGVAYASAYAQNDVIGVALDMDGGTLTFYKNGTSQGQAFSGLSGTFFPAVSDGDATNAVVFASNFGQQPFTYTPPTGFVRLNTFNLTTPTIGATASSQANKYMDATLYTGNGTTQSITNSGSMQPDWVWLKARSNAYTHVLVDSIRGTDKVLSSPSTSAENSTNPGEDFTAFNSNGFSVGTPVSFNSTNASGATIVAWQWRASNATAVTNTNGSITSTVSANTTAGFSIVTYTGTGANATVGHGLGVAPSMIITKRRSGATENWGVYHISTGSTAGLFLNLTDASLTNSTFWNNTSPTSSVFSVGSGSSTNPSAPVVAYCFAQIAGYSAFGSYTGNGSTDGPFVFTNFRPRWIMIKRTDSTQNWIIVDTSRDTYNIANKRLFANLSDAEDTGITNYLDILSNGFKCRDSNVSYNASSGTYIYMAFAENPFKYANAR